MDLIYALFWIKVLPLEQRAISRALSDDYVSEVNGDPAEHLPENARDVLGKINPEVIERMQRSIQLMLSRTADG